MNGGSLKFDLQTPEGGYRAELDASDAVAQLVQWGRPAHDAHHVGDHQQNPAGDTGLSRQTDLEQTRRQSEESNVSMSLCNVSKSGIPTWKANCPEKSYMPQECIRLRVFRTASGLSTRSPVIGHMPPLARVAAMTLALSQFTSMEHSWGGGCENDTSERSELADFKCSP